MRVLVCGSRDFRDIDAMGKKLSLVHAEYDIDVLIHGDARGADRTAGLWAKHHDIPVIKFPAEWEKYGNNAGPIRNRQMLDEGKPDLIVAFPYGDLNDPKRNFGTRDMVKQARAAGIKTIVIEE